MGAAQHRTLIPALAVAAGAASILAAPGPASADNWWPSRQFAHPENADIYTDGEVFKEIAADWYREKDGGYTEVYSEPRAAYFNGKRLTRTYKPTPGGTYAKIFGGKGKHFEWVKLFRKGEPYLTQIPHFAGDTATWQPFTVRRPLPITGTLKVTADVFSKTTGERPQWDCSVYYKDVCRWWKGRKAVPLHKVRTVTKRWKLSTTIGPDKFTSVYNGLGLGWWNGDASTIPAEFTSNPMLPVVYGQHYDCGVGQNNVCGRVLDNEAVVTKTEIKK